MKLSSLLIDSHTKNITKFYDTNGTFLPKPGEICLPLLLGDVDIINDMNFIYFRTATNLSNTQTGIFLRVQELFNRGYCLT
jgi:hypothetical protein